MREFCHCSVFKSFWALGTVLVGLAGCSASRVPTASTPPAVTATLPRPTTPTVERGPHVMLGIDVLQSTGFAAIRNKRVGLLTHPAGVNRFGVSTIDVLHHAPGVNLVALFGPEHGIYGNEKAEIHIPNRIDPATGLPVYSLYGKYRKPTKAMLRGLDAMVIDLQDIGTRSYTFSSSMLYTMAACFENGVEVVVLDRPNPLGGLKVDGPVLDPKWKSYVGAFCVPYVHGLTIGELARMAKEKPGVMHVPGAIDVSEADRKRGKLTIVPMRGWRRSMRWPETGLKWVPTSPYIPDFAAVLGYPMMGLGTYLGSFSHGVGRYYPFRGISSSRVPDRILIRVLRALHLPGLAYREVSVPVGGGRHGTGIYVQITNYKDWHPTELSFYLMALACKYDARNPFANATRSETSGFLKHMGSPEFFEALQRDGAHVDVASYIRKWEAECRAYQQQTRRYWLYR